MLLKNSINPFEPNFSFLRPLKTLSISGCTESNDSDCRKRKGIKNTD